MDEYDEMFSRAPSANKEKDLILEIDTRKFIKRKRKDDPVTIILKLPISDDIKHKAIKFYNDYIDDLEISSKDTPACVFYSIYIASRELKVLVSLDTIARISGLGMEKFEPEIQLNSLDYGVKLDHKKVTNTITYFATELKNYKFNTEPEPVREFIKAFIEEQNLEDYSAYVLEFTDMLLEDEFWTDQNPNLLAYAILSYLSSQADSPFKGQSIKVPPYFSKNIILDLISKIKTEVLSFEEEE